jgi:hypothetical protein
MSVRHCVFGLAVVALAAACNRPKPTREILVFGDSNFSDNLASNDAGNVRMHKNLVNFTAPGRRRQAKKVLIHLGHDSYCNAHVSNCLSSGAPSSTFETTLTGEGYQVVHVDDATAPLTQPVNDSVKVIFLFMPTTPYSAAEAQTLKAFVTSGGRLVLVGDGAMPVYPMTKPVVNGLLQLLGSSLQHADPIECPGYKVMPATSIRPHQITTGLTQLTLACASDFQLAPGDSGIVYDRTGVHPIVVRTRVGAP